jgi:hypothetical protein
MELNFHSGVNLITGEEQMMGSKAKITKFALTN